MDNDQEHLPKAHQPWQAPSFEVLGLAGSQGGGPAVPEGSGGFLTS